VPVYAFTCADCGPFDLVRPMVESGAPGRCPGCGSDARRVFSPPGIALLERRVRTALDIQEKSAHEPEVVSQKRGRPMPHRHAPSPPWAVGH
jgi:putative FmdB family regulatory protein